MIEQTKIKQYFDNLFLEEKNKRNSWEENSKDKKEIMFEKLYSQMQKKILETCLKTSNNQKNNIGNGYIEGYMEAYLNEASLSEKDFKEVYDKVIKEILRKYNFLNIEKYQTDNLILKISPSPIIKKKEVAYHDGDIEVRGYNPFWFKALVAALKNKTLYLTKPHMYTTLNTLDAIEKHQAIHEEKEKLLKIKDGDVENPEIIKQHKVIHKPVL